MSDQPPRTTDDRLDEIIHVLRKYEQREKRRSFWHSVTGVIKLAPLCISLYFMYYFFANGDQIMSDIIQKSAEATTRSYTETVQGGTENLSNTIKDLLGQ